MFATYARFIVRRSFLLILFVSLISTILTLIPLLCHTFPSFSDPIMGFETRGTELAHRFVAWENLIEETRPSKRLAVNPQEISDQLRMNLTYSKVNLDTPRSKHGKPNNKRKKKKKNYTATKNITNFREVSLDQNTSNSHVHWGYGTNVSYEDEDADLIRNHTRKKWVSLKKMDRTPNYLLNHNYASGTCGSPIVDYAHLVIESTELSSLLTFENVLKICKLQNFLIELGKKEYHKLCQRSTHAEELCCPIWSVPNYIALMSEKSSCVNLSIQDVDDAVLVLKKCAGYFHNFTLMSSCSRSRCNVPSYCSRYDAVYNLLFYLIDSNAFSPSDTSQTFVINTMVFLPLPSSSTVLPYYTKLQSSSLSFDSLIIAAIDFGLKNTLFDKWIIEDTWLVGLGGCFVFLCVWIYTKSLILTILLFIAITYSLGIAYFLYVYVFNLEFFPFMNLLVIVVVIGIGADDAFLYVKVWKMVGKQLIKDNIVAPDDNLTNIGNVYSAGETILIQVVEETIRHSVVTMLITTVTTAVAFYASYVSYIPAINCFSVFAGTAVLVNFLLMITWLPTSVYIVDVILCKSKNHFMDSTYKSVTEACTDLRSILNRFIIMCVAKLHIGFVVVLGSIGIASVVVVFYYPGLQLPDSRQFQLFQSSHPFEKYDSLYREKFLFERFGNGIGTGSKMPLRWIWGIKATDNGNHMDPTSTGHLIFDDSFSISDPASQVWLLNFCKKIKAQPFYQSTLGPLLPNCFIESFNSFMSRRCMDNISRINRSPCCESSQFPFEREVFEYCILKAMESLYQTPRELFMPGVAGPKFLRNTYPPRIGAMVVEFESVVPYSMSYTLMQNFYIHVDNWTMEELKSAPEGVKRGWFLSDLQFFDLQQTLASGTIIALVFSASLGFLMLIPVTLNFVISVSALSAMIFSSTVTISILVLSGWKLNVLESVAISTSAGLAVDFSLHYTLSYRNASGSKRARVKYALSASAGPTAAAALTTGFAGIFLLRSNLLPYSQIGTFLALIMSVSWVYATFFLCSLLYVFGSSQSKDIQIEERKSESRVSSVCSGVPNLESHELEHLADSSRTNISQSHSPSSISGTTVVVHDDSEVSQARLETTLGKET